MDLSKDMSFQNALVSSAKCSQDDTYPCVSRIEDSCLFQPETWLIYRTTVTEVHGEIDKWSWKDVSEMKVLNSLVLEKYKCM